MATPYDELARLSEYNSGAYNAGSNPYGMDDYGHVTNFPLALSDLTAVLNYYGPLLALGLADAEDIENDILPLLPSQVADRTALKALTTPSIRAAILMEAGRQGIFCWDSSDLSAKIAPRSVTSTGVDSGTEIVTKAGHGLVTGQAVIATSTINGLTADTLYYAIYASSSTFKLASSRANAVAGTAFNLTGTTNFTLKIIPDDLEGIYVVPTGKARDGSQGAWTRQYSGLPSVKWWGVAGDSNGTSGNGTDDTAALQAICIAGGTYDVPFGSVIRTTLPIAMAVATSFIGQGCNPFVDLDETAANVRGLGSWFYIDHTGKGFVGDGTSGPSDGLAVVRFKGVGTFRNQPTPGGGAFTPTANDYDFDMTDVEIEMDDFVCLNPTKFLTATLARGGRARFNNVRGQPLSEGIKLDQVYDVTHLDVHFWPYWSLNAQVTTYTKANLQSLITGRVDGLLMQRFFTIYAACSWVVADFGSGVINQAHCDWFYSDNSTKALSIGASADGCTIHFNEYTAYGINSSTSNGLEIAGDNNEISIDFGNWDNHYNWCGYLAGTGNRVTVNQAELVEWGYDSAATQAFVVEAGNKLIFNGAIEFSPHNAANPLAGGAGIVEFTGGEAMTLLYADRAGSDSSTAQSPFASTEDALTPFAGIAYEFEGLFIFSRAAGSTSHTTGVLFAGTATVNAIGFDAQVSNPTGNVLSAVSEISAAVATETVLTAANTSTTENVRIRVRGHVHFGAVGTFIPQIKYSAAPGGAPTFKKGSFFKLKPLGLAGMVKLGGWA